MARATIEAERDLNAINAVLGSTAEPVDREDDDDEAFADENPEPVAAPVVASPALSVPGLPNLAEHPAVVAAQANVNRVTEQAAVAAAEIAALEKELGIQAGASARDLDQLAAKLLAAGSTDDGSEKFAKLESLRVHAKRLRMAGEIAAREFQAAREKAVRDLSAKAWEAEFKPAARKSALALLELVRQKQQENDARNRLRAGGFASPNGTFDSPILDEYSNPFLVSLVRDGYLTRDEVKAVCPHLGGI